MRYFKVVLALGFILAVRPSYLLAEVHTQMHTDAVSQATPKLNPDEVVITGKVTDNNSLIIEKIIDAQGNNIKEEKGKTYQFLRNGQLDELVKDSTYIGKTIIVVGKADRKENSVEIRFFKEKAEEGK